MTAPPAPSRRALTARATFAVALACAPILAVACAFHPTGTGPAGAQDTTTTTTGAGGTTTTTVTTGSGGTGTTSSTTTTTATTTTTTASGSGGTGGMPPLFPYAYRRRLRVSNPTADIPSEYSIPITLDHAALVAGGKSLASGDDVRIFRDEAGTLVELDRRVDPASAWDTAQTTIWLRTRDALPKTIEDASYWIYYGNPDAGAPPADGNKVYAIWTDFDTGAPQGNGWTLSTIGNASGATSEVDSTLTLETKSGDIWGNADNFVFLHHSISGDFVADTRVVSMSGSLGGWSKMGGVMIRQSTNPSSRNRIMSPVHDDAARTNSYRLSDGAGTTEDASGNDDPTPEYERVTRLGDVSRAFHSADGRSWQEDGGPVTFGQALVDPILVGIPACNLSGSKGEVDVDWFRVRKLIEPEPTVSVGMEEPGPG